MQESPDPIARFLEALAAAQASESFDVSRCALATCRDGQPSVRMVLVKDVDPRGFVFYTNLRSAKSEDLEANPRAALCFHWWTIGQQVRVEGSVSLVSDAEANAYFASRPRGSQLAAWASDQSCEIESREQLLDQLRQVEERFKGGEVPRPPFWSGYRLEPVRIEFWYNREHRLHDRICYHRTADGYRVTRLAP